MSADNRISRRDLFRLAGAGGATLLACNMPGLINAATQTGNQTGERNLGPTPSPDPTVTLSPELQIEGDTPEKMLANFFMQYLGLVPKEVNGTLQFESLIDGDIYHIDGFDPQECIEPGVRVARVNLFLKGSACTAPKEVADPTSTNPPNVEPTRTKKNPPPSEPTKEVTPPKSTLPPTQQGQPQTPEGEGGSIPDQPTPVSTPRPATEQPIPEVPTDQINTPVPGF